MVSVWKRGCASEDLANTGQLRNHPLNDTSLSHVSQHTAGPCVWPWGEGTLLPLASKRALPPLIGGYKNGSSFYLNVNYCYDTQDNLTCFSNLFLLVIRCSNWKIFQSVTTVPKVQWQGVGASPLDVTQEPVAGWSTGSRLEKPLQGSDTVLPEPSVWPP